jgi:hypothetical protein
MTPVDEIANGRYIHWGSPCSLYSGKTRSYLIKKNIDFVEIAPSHPHFLERVVSKVGYFSLPVLETPTGEIIQDSTDKSHPADVG